MISSLYDCFKHWSKTGSVYIISDTHFDDSDCKLMSKNWISPEEHIKLLNKMVHKTDTLIHLGDVGNVEWIKQLKCYKVLIMGNHDAGKSKYQRRAEFIKEFNTFSDAETAERKGEIDYIESGFHKPFIAGYKSNKLFNEVFEGPLMISEKIILSHEPILGLPYVLNIHGHDHSGSFIDANHINVASNVCNYTPLNLGAYIKEHGLSQIKSIHRQTIDNATQRKNERERLERTGLCTINFSEKIGGFTEKKVAVFNPEFISLDEAVKIIKSDNSSPYVTVMTKEQYENIFRIFKNKIFIKGTYFSQIKE